MTRENTLKELHNENLIPGKKIMKIAGNVLFALIILFSVLISIYVLQNRQRNEDLSVLNHRLLIVLSGSMSPEFNTGSAIIVKNIDPFLIELNDVITFKGISETGNTTTHRVIEIINDENLLFRTKGDANDVADPNLVPAESVVGKVRFSVPLMGYVLNFAKSKIGGYVLIIVPAMVIILYEVNKLLKIAFAKNGTTKEEPAIIEDSLGGDEIMDNNGIENELNQWMVTLPKTETQNDVQDKDVTTQNKKQDNRSFVESSNNNDFNDASLIYELKRELALKKQSVGKLQENLNNNDTISYSQAEIDKHVVNLLYEAHKESVKKVYDHKKLVNKIKNQLSKQISLKKSEEDEYDVMILKLKKELKIKLNAYEIVRGNN